MKRIAVASLLLAACGAGENGRAGVESADLAITHVHVVDVEGGLTLPDHTVLIEGSRIVDVGASDDVRVPPDAQVVDGTGKYLIPGLVDSHVHRWWGAGTDVDTVPLFALLLANGVTTVREASGSGREGELVGLREQVERGELLAPRLYVSGTASTANQERYGAQDLPALVRTLADMNVDGIKLIYLTAEEAVQTIQEARRVRLPVYGHTHLAGGLQRPELPFGLHGYAKEAIAAGISGIMHVSALTPAPAAGAEPALTPGQPRDAQLAQVIPWFYDGMFDVWRGMSDAAVDELVDAMVARGVWLEPTLVTEDIEVHRERYRGHPAEAYVGSTVDEMWGPGFGSPEKAPARQAAFGRMGELVRRFHARGGLVLAGSDNAPLAGVGLHDELARLVEAGLSPTAALQAATSNPARAFGRADRIGTVASGKLADLVLLSANPLDDIGNAKRIEGVVMNGRYLDRAALDALLGEAQRAASPR